jgi:hypothetical protein
MRAMLECECGHVETVDAETSMELCAQSLAVGVAMHACKAHQAHKVQLRLEPETARSLLGEGARKHLHIECLAGGCSDRATPTQLDAGLVPAELIGALALCFHTSHEGHPFRITWGDQSWESPRPP